MPQVLKRITLVQITRLKSKDPHAYMQPGKLLMLECMMSCLAAGGKEPVHCKDQEWSLEHGHFESVFNHNGQDSNLVHKFGHRLCEPGKQWRVHYTEKKGCHIIKKGTFLFTEAHKNNKDTIPGLTFYDGLYSDCKILTQSSNFGKLGLTSHIQTYDGSNQIDGKGITMVDEVGAGGLFNCCLKPEDVNVKFVVRMDEKVKMPQPNQRMYRRYYVAIPTRSIADGEELFYDYMSSCRLTQPSYLMDILQFPDSLATDNLYRRIFKREPVKPLKFG